MIISPIIAHNLVHFNEILDVHEKFIRRVFKVQIASRKIKSNQVPNFKDLFIEMYVRLRYVKNKINYKHWRDTQKESLM